MTFQKKKNIEYFPVIEAQHLNIGINVLYSSYEISPQEE